MMIRGISRISTPAVEKRNLCGVVADFVIRRRSRPGTKNHLSYIGHIHLHMISSLAFFSLIHLEMIKSEISEIKNCHVFFSPEKYLSQHVALPPLPLRAILVCRPCFMMIPFCEMPSYGRDGQNTWIIIPRKPLRYESPTKTNHREIGRTCNPQLNANINIHKSRKSAMIPMKNPHFPHGLSLLINMDLWKPPYVPWSKHGLVSRIEGAGHPTIVAWI